MPDERLRIETFDFSGHEDEEMDYEDFMETCAAPFMQQFEQLSVAHISMVSPRRVKTNQELRRLFLSLAQKISAILTIIYDPVEMVYQYKCETPYIELCKETMQLFAPLIRLVDSVEILSDDEGAVIIAVDWPVMEYKVIPVRLYRKGLGFNVPYQNKQLKPKRHPIPADDSGNKII